MVTGADVVGAGAADVDVDDGVAGVACAAAAAVSSLLFLLLIPVLPAIICCILVFLSTADRELSFITV